MDETPKGGDHAGEETLRLVFSAECRGQPGDVTCATSEQIIDILGNTFCHGGGQIVGDIRMIPLPGVNIMKKRIRSFGISLAKTRSKLQNRHDILSREYKTYKLKERAFCDVYKTLCESTYIVPQRLANIIGKLQKQKQLLNSKIAIFNTDMKKFKKDQTLYRDLETAMKQIEGKDGNA